MNRVLRKTRKQFNLRRGELTKRFRSNRRIEYARYQFVADCYLEDIPAEIVAAKLNVCKKYHGEILRMSLRSGDWLTNLHKLSR
jgi:tRNA splicing ligase